MNRLEKIEKKLKRRRRFFTSSLFLVIVAMLFIPSFFHPLHMAVIVIMSVSFGIYMCLVITTLGWTIKPGNRVWKLKGWQQYKKEHPLFFGDWRVKSIL